LTLFLKTFSFTAFLHKGLKLFHSFAGRKGLPSRRCRSSCLSLCFFCFFI